MKFDLKWPSGHWGKYGHVFFVKSLLVTSPIILQMLKYLFSSVPCNTKFVKKRNNNTFSNSFFFLKTRSFRLKRKKYQ